MAHVHGAAQTSKHAAHAAHSSHAAHASHAAHHASHASSHAAQAAHHASHAAHGAHAVHAAAGAMVVAKSAAVGNVKKKAGKSFLGKVLSHPVVLFGLGVAVGYSIHKYRKEIIHSANRAAEKSKDFVLQQRENLEDLIGENPADDN